MSVADFSQIQRHIMHKMQIKLIEMKKREYYEILCYFSEQEWNKMASIIHR